MNRLIMLGVRKTIRFLDRLYRIVNDVLRDLVHRLCQGVVCCRHIMPFHGTRVNVIPFTPIRNVRSSMPRFLRNSPMLYSIYVQIISNFAQIWQ
jgi:hypothetical protein